MSPFALLDFWFEVLGSILEEGRFFVFFFGVLNLFFVYFDFQLSFISPTLLEGNPSHISTSTTTILEAVPLSTISESTPSVRGTEFSKSCVLKITKVVHVKAPTSAGWLLGLSVHSTIDNHIKNTAFKFIDLDLWLIEIVYVHLRSPSRQVVRDSFYLQPGKASFANPTHCLLILNGGSISKWVSVAGSAASGQASSLPTFGY